MIDVEALVRQPHRPGAGEAERRARRAGSGGRFWRRQLAIWRLDRLHDQRAQRLDLGLDPAEQGAVGLGAAAQRLLQRLMPGEMQAAQPLGERVERRQSIADVVDADQALVALGHLPARSPVSRHAASTIGDEQILRVAPRHGVGAASASSGRPARSKWRM